MSSSEDAASWAKYAMSCVPPPERVFENHDPFLHNSIKCFRKTRDYKEVQVQFLESSGIQTIGPFESGLTFKGAYVSGPTCYKCVTNQISLSNLLNVDCMQKNGVIKIDTGKLNQYAGGDIEPGKRKIISVTYIVEDVTIVEVRKVQRPLFTESTVHVEKRYTEQPDGSCKTELVTGLSGNQLNSEVYAYNSCFVQDEWNGTYGQFSEAIIYKKDLCTGPKCGDSTSGGDSGSGSC